MIKLTATAVYASLTWIASFAVVSLLSADELATSRTEIVGQVTEDWNENRRRHEIVVRNESDNVRYLLLSNRDFRPKEWLGRRISITGHARLRANATDGLIRPDDVRVLDDNVRSANTDLVNTNDETQPPLDALEMTANEEPEEFIADSNSQPLTTNLAAYITQEPESTETLPPPAESIVTEELDFPVPDSGMVDGMVMADGKGYVHGTRACDVCDAAVCFHHMWGQVDYLYWKTSGMNLPPLVTTSTGMPPQTQAGVINQPGTQILFGNSEILDDYRSGFRARLGAWLGPNLGVEGEYIGLADESTGFAATSDGSTVLAVPFFNLNPRDPTNPALFAPAREDSFLVGFTSPAGAPLTSGNIAISASNQFDSAGVRAVVPVAGYSSSHTFSDDCMVDVLLGYRYLNLDDQLGLRARVTTLDGSNQVFDITDSFATTNEFHGFDTGAQVRGNWCGLSCGLLAKVAIGATDQKAVIAGNTNITTGGVTTPNAGGLFAQPPNSNTFSRNEFTAVPELGAHVDLCCSEHINLRIGYSLIYWSRVLRAGDQIDRDINRDFLPPGAMPFTGPTNRPEFVFRESAFWTQGLSVGLACDW